MSRKSFKKFVIRNADGKFFWRFVSRSGVHFENEIMPCFSELGSHTYLFDSQQEAEKVCRRPDTRLFESTASVVEMTITYKVKNDG